MTSLLEVIQKSAQFLEGKGVESPRLNAEILVGHALGLKRMQLYLQFERPLSEPELESIRQLLRRRGRREPLGYVLGRGEFFGLELRLDRRALIPRPETEYLMELLTRRLDPPPARVADLGCGSGAIALSLARAWPSAEVTGLDESADALSLSLENARANAMEHRVAWLKSNWFDSLEPTLRFDLIVSNPPYLTEDEARGAPPEVRDYEPASALVGGGDGMEDLRAILSGAPARLSAGGMIALETGPEQHASLAAAAAAAGFARTESVKDLAGRSRYLFGWL